MLLLQNFNKPLVVMALIKYPWIMIIKAKKVFLLGLTRPPTPIL